jgi:peptide-methionine (S)-S-oxide reductase
VDLLKIYLDLYTDEKQFCYGLPFKNIKEGRILKEKESTESGLATFGGGCFWCVEAVFKRIEGVRSVASGYAGGMTKNPTYEEVCTGNTGHAEVVQIEYDTGQISYGELLQIFWKSHDPTTLDRQGGDMGTQYRSIILYHDDEQRITAEESKGRADASGDFKGPIVTQIKPFGVFYPAEDYHQDYYDKNPHAGYCVINIRPKLKKLGI